ncbi:unnamed protein product [Cyprideis torosa]|uniref:Peptidase M20 dimerisation domain-containing protein n=1 Tax=Cyprideis torosa TaxID=163714 RepID=A0A7R8WGC5_9CRUS|nr:unnamed protein product [Cyprideis torosa]CAG0898012.1 unnamed protein product [Cyprideis torosa]
MDKVLAYVEEHKADFIQNLKEAVAIQSVSAWPQKRPEIKKMLEWAGSRLESFGAEIEYANIGSQTLPDGDVIPLPPVLLGSLGNDPAKVTLVLYGHLDVQPASKSDGWDTEPFELTEKDGKLFGRGASDDKGPVLGWIHVIEAFKNTGVDLPVNLKFVFEGMEESGSEGLDDLLEQRSSSFFKGVDYVCISDNYWLGTEKPCLTYGLRGNVYFFIEVECADKDLHSGVFGGVVHEAMADLVYLMNQLLGMDGKILIPGVYDTVAPLTKEEEELYEKMDFDPEKLRSDIGCKCLNNEGKKEAVLMAKMRNPTLSLHGIEGAFSDAGCKTVIPRKVIGKFSLRIVPNQTVEGITKLTEDYINSLWEARKSPNKMKVKMVHGGPHWLTDPFGPQFQAGVKATKRVYGVEPDLTREGGSIPVTLTLQRVSGKSVMLLPMGAADDGAHSQNEKIDVRNYIMGVNMEKVPAVAYASRGFIHFTIHVRGLKENVHSGHHGGVIYEPLADLVYYLNTLTDSEGKVLVTGFYDNIEPLTADEAATYRCAPFSPKAYQKMLGARGIRHQDKIEALARRWHYPSLSLHGIDGAPRHREGVKASIAASVSGRFSIRIVPSQNPEEIKSLVVQHFSKMVEARKSPNEVKVM